jgi:5'-3' exonuclease
LHDLANNIQSNISEFDKILNDWKLIGTTQGFIDSTVQLLSILPYESKELLPYYIQKLVTDPKYGCAHLYPKVYPIQTYLKTHLWECVPVLPSLDIELIQICIKEFT